MRTIRPSSRHGKVDIVALLCLCSLTALIAVMLACCKAELVVPRGIKWLLSLSPGAKERQLCVSLQGSSLVRHPCVWNEVLAYYILCSVHYILHTSFFNGIIT